MMKKAVFLLLSFVFSFHMMSQNDNAIDLKVQGYPSQFKNTQALASKIAKDFKTDRSRVRALYYWLSTNIAYDMNEFLRGSKFQRFQYRTEEEKQQKIKELNEQIVRKTLINKKAVCEGYAQTFHQVCLALNIESEVVAGFSKVDYSDIGAIRKNGDHAWNAVKIDGQWRLLDATWSAGAAKGSQWEPRFNDFFFLTDPAIFVLTHLPYENKWQLLNRPVSKATFFNTPVYKQYFFDYDMSLVNPLQGRLRLTSNEKIKFSLKNVPQDLRLFYAFQGDKFSEEIEREIVNGVTHFEIPFAKNKDAVLYILAFRKVILSYRIELVR